MSDKLKKRLQLIIGAVALYLVIMVVDKLHLIDAVSNNHWINLVLYLVPFLIAGWPVVRKAGLGIKNRQPFDESFLMTIASIGAFITGESSEAAAVMLFYQVGEWFQDYAVGKSRGSISQLMDIVPEEACVEREDGSVETVDPDDVEVGDILVIKAGDKIPVDGTVISGQSMINTAALTGESVPRSVREGEQLISGCINGEGLLRMRADKIFDDSTVAKVLELVENASEAKSKTENFITRFARVYTPAVVIAALVLAILPPLVTGGNWMSWIYRACTFLVISCPCALVISVPLAFFGGIGAASKTGVLVKGSNYLELLAHVETVVSDKTGTLTEGNFVVTEVIPAEGFTREQVLLMAAEAEGMSTHPIARSIREAYEKDTEKQVPAVAVDTENVSGQGLIANSGGREIAVGNEKLMQERQVSYVPAGNGAATVVYVAENTAYAGAILIRDEVKAGAKEALAAMKSAGVRKTVMLTGDRDSVAREVGEQLGLDKTYSQLMPQDKVSKVEELLAELGRADDPKRGRLAFIGDGINDAPVLTRADIGIAMGSMGSDAAIEAADVVIMDDDLERLPAVIRIARKTVRLSTMNIVFALVVKALILVLGAFGLANMWAAVFADVGVAVICILNSMRLLRVKKTI